MEACQRIPIRTAPEAPGGNARGPCSGSGVVSIPLGTPGSLNFRLLFLDERTQRHVSPWHDIQLYRPEGHLSFVCKAPAGSWICHEVSQDEPSNPIRPVRRDEVKDDDVAVMSRFSLRRREKHHRDSFDGMDEPSAKERAAPCLPLSNSFSQEEQDERNMEQCLPAHYPDNVPWNVGFLPQTCNGTACMERGGRGGATVEVVEVGAERLRRVGEVYSVKPLGALLSEEEGGAASWLVVAIAADDPVVKLMGDAHEVEEYLPRIWEMIREWVCSDRRAAGIWKRGVRVIRRPVDLVRTQRHIGQCHVAWQHSSARRAALSDAHLSRPAGLPLTILDLQMLWRQCVEDTPSEFNADIPLACPPSQSSVLWDKRWFKQGREKCTAIFPDRDVYDDLPSPTKPSIVTCGVTGQFRLRAQQLPGVAGDDKGLPDLLTPPPVHADTQWLRSQSCPERSSEILEATRVPTKRSHRRSLEMVSRRSIELVTSLWHTVGPSVMGSAGKGVDGSAPSYKLSGTSSLNGRRSRITRISEVCYERPFDPV